jgi:hypothetical protein
MTVINVNSVSGISSITAQSNSITFYDTSGNLASIGASLAASTTLNPSTIIPAINGGAISGARNKLINSAMEIDQRNAGLSLSLNNIGLYSCDRWLVSAFGGAGTGTATVQRVADAPSGFVYSLKYTVTNAKTPVGSDQFYITQLIEGQNIIDFQYGTASAKPVTLSFWVKSSLNGTFSGCVRANDATVTYRSYVFNYTITSTNTWQYITVTAPGDTAAVPQYNNSTGYTVLFDLGTGSTFQTSTLNSWVTGNYIRSTTSTNLISTIGATFQVTGVQLESGSVATPFERRLYGHELALCQRYYEKSYDTEIVPGTATSNGSWCGVNLNAGEFYSLGLCQFRVTKRSTPLVSMWSINGVANQLYNAGTQTNVGNSQATLIGQNGCRFSCSNQAMSPVNSGYFTHWTASAEISALN